MSQPDELRERADLAVRLASRYPGYVETREVVEALARATRAAANRIERLEAQQAAALALVEVGEQTAARTVSTASIRRALTEDTP